MHPDPLDLQEIAGGDAHRIDSGRPLGLGQGHREFSFPRWAFFARHQVDHKEHRGAHRGIDGEIGPKIAMDPGSRLRRRYESADGRPEEGAHQETRCGGVASHLYLEWIIAPRFDPDNVAPPPSFQPDLDGGRALRLAVDADADGQGRRRGGEGDRFRSPPRERRTARREEDARASQKENEPISSDRRSPLPARSTSFCREWNFPSTATVEETSGSAGGLRTGP